MRAKYTGAQGAPFVVLVVALILALALFVVVKHTKRDTDRTIIDCCGDKGLWDCSYTPMRYDGARRYLVSGLRGDGQQALYITNGDCGGAK